MFGIHVILSNATAAQGMPKLKDSVPRCKAKSHCVAPGARIPTKHEAPAILLHEHQLRGVLCDHVLECARLCSLLVPIWSLQGPLLSHQFTTISTLNLAIGIPLASYLALNGAVVRVQVVVTALLVIWCGISLARSFVPVRYPLAEQPAPTS